MAYYGLMLNSVNLPGSIYLNVVYLGLAELVAWVYPQVNTVEFFTNFPQYKNASIANLISIVSLATKYTNLQYNPLVVTNIYFHIYSY